MGKKSLILPCNRRVSKMNNFQPKDSGPIDLPVVNLLYFIRYLKVLLMIAYFSLKQNVQNIGPFTYVAP